jgi:type I restriction enzyme S subunit
MSWHTTRLGDVLTLKRGHDLPDSERKDGDIPIVSSSGITGYHNEPRAKAPGVVTGRYGTLGEVFYVEKDYWPLNTALYVTDFKGNHPRFVAYFLQNVLKSYQSDKAAVPGVNRNVIHKLKVQYPDIKSQEHIVKILSSYDDFIDTNRRRIQLLEELARLLFREWFVYFRFPRLRQGFGGQAGHEKAKMVDGAPEGWKKEKIKKILTLEYGKSLVADKRENGDIPVYGSSGVIGFHNKALVKGPGIIVGRAGNAGAVHWVNDDFFPVDSTFYVKTKMNNLLLYFYYYLSICHLERFISGSAVPGLNRNIVYSSNILLPETNIVEKFNELADQINKQCSYLGSQNQKLAQARDLLLPRLMRGAIEL